MEGEHTKFFIGYKVRVTLSAYEASDVWAAMKELTQRESEILELLLAGLSSKDIAENLKISRFTVDHHRTHIMDKLKSPSLSGLTSTVAIAKDLFEKHNPLVDDSDRKS